MPSLQYTGSDLRRRVRFILSPIFKTSFPYFFFFSWRMWHICISLFSLIRICWLKLNEINSSWWHWIRLCFSLNTLHTVDSLITGSRSHTFVSTNVGAPSLPPLFFPPWLTAIRQFPARVLMLRNLPLNYLSISGLPFLPWERFWD